MDLLDLQEIDDGQPLVGSSVWQEGDSCMCGVGTIVERTNRNTGEKFLACSNYPACKITY